MLHAFFGAGIAGFGYQFADLCNERAVASHSLNSHSAQIRTFAIQAQTFAKFENIKAFQAGNVACIADIHAADASINALFVCSYGHICHVVCLPV